MGETTARATQASWGGVALALARPTPPIDPHCSSAHGQKLGPPVCPSLGSPIAVRISSGVLEGTGRTLPSHQTNRQTPGCRPPKQLLTLSWLPVRGSV